MKFSEKLKELRQQNGYSQEQLAEKINVSRQAITKWETGIGYPDLENLLSISKLFGLTIDELINEEKTSILNSSSLQESRTEYDLDTQKKIDLKLGCAYGITIERTREEKIQVIASSSTVSDIASKVKVKIDESKNRMDVVVKHSLDFTDSSAMKNLSISVKIPEKFVACAELSCQTENLFIRDITFDSIEASGKIENVSFVKAEGHLEIDSNTNLTLKIRDSRGRVDLNQISCISKAVLDDKMTVFLKNEGRNTRFVDEKSEVISDGKWGNKAEDAEIDCDLILELNGFKSELQISKIE